MRSHRKLLIFVLMVVAATAAVVVYQRMAGPAWAVLMLPEGDMVFYADLAPIPFVNLGQFVDVQQLPGKSDPEYQDFLRQTHFHVEHDLKTIAVSVRNPGESNSEYSAVLTGIFDQDALRSYMQRHSTGSENYSGKTIFFITQNGHTLRACVLDSNAVALANMDSPEVMHSIIDKARGSLLHRGGPQVVRDYFHFVPVGSLAWAMIHVPQQPDGGQISGWNIDFLQNAVSVISVRYTGSVRVRAEIVSANTSDASRVLEAANTMVALAKSAGESLSPGGPDKDVKAVFDNIQVQQNANRTVLSVVLPPEFLRKMAASMNH